MYKEEKIIEIEKLAEAYERAGKGRKAMELRRKIIKNISCLFFCCDCWRNT
ncbi:MAG: hypothetical protein QXL50_02465 [Candidatus Pacearchaeota archaeon]